MRRGRPDPIREDRPTSSLPLYPYRRTHIGRGLMTSGSYVATEPVSDPHNPGLVEVDSLSVEFSSPGWRTPPVRIVNDVSFDVNRGETLGLVGESGSGKSTIARAMLGLVPSVAGSVHIDNVDLLKLSRKALRKHRQHAQMVFQDPFSSINPSMIVRDIIGEPIDVHER